MYYLIIKKGGCPSSSQHHYNNLKKVLVSMCEGLECPFSNELRIKHFSDQNIGPAGHVCLGHFCGALCNYLDHVREAVLRDHLTCYSGHRTENLQNGRAVFRDICNLAKSENQYCTFIVAQFRSKFKYCSASNLVVHTT